MNIAIIGAGNVGTGLAIVLSKTRHGIAMGARTTEAGESAARTLKVEHDIRVQGSDIRTAVASADIVFLAVPFAEVGSVAASADFTGKTVVDVTNPLTADYSALVIGHDTSAAEEIRTLLPDSSIVKGFNTLFAQVYLQGPDFGGRAAPVFLATDDDAARERVRTLALDAGFDPVNAGPLTNARYLEPLAALNIQLGYMQGLGTQIVPAWLTR